jgi:hypothetical protein
MWDVTTNPKPKGNKSINQPVKAGRFESTRGAVKAGLAEPVKRRQRLHILALEGTIDFAPDWDYKEMRRLN